MGGASQGKHSAAAGDVQKKLLPQHFGQNVRQESVRSENPPPPPIPRCITMTSAQDLKEDKTPESCAVSRFDRGGAILGWVLDYYIVV